MLSIKVPPLGESVVEATVGRWLKQEGDAVQSGETIVELETDKINVEVPALRAGVLRKRMKNEGDVVKVDEVLGELEEGAAPAAGSAAKSRAAEPAAASAASRGAAPAATSATASAPPPRSGGAASGAAAESKTSPAARKTAAESGVDISRVSGTGRGGTVSKPDVIEQAAGARPPSAPAPSAPAPAGPSAATRPTPAGNGARETRERMSTRRKRIAEHLLEAKQATAALTTFNEVDMTALSQLRERFRDKVEKEHGVKLTFMPFFVKAACIALADFPVVNARIDGDAILYHHYVNMGIAVASEQGLVVPNIRDADRKGIIDLSHDIVAIAKRARDGKLTMDDLTGGTFTITNGGVFGSLVSTPILNYPQVGILGLHKIQDRPVAVDGRVEIRPMMYLALTYDHRIIDGQQAVLFLVRIKELIEEPAAMIIA